MCRNRLQLEEKLAAANTIITALSNRVNALEELVANNSGSRITTPQPTVSVPSPRRMLENTNQTASSPSLPTNASPQEFVPVRNGVQPRKRKILPVTTYNKFQILADREEDTNEVRLVGDSMVRGQLVEFCGRAPNNRKRFCIPGAGVNDVSEALEEVTDDMPDNSLVVLHTGTNDVVRTRSEELMQRYKQMIRHYKNKTNNIIISGIIPRIGAENTFYSKAFSINNRLKSLCIQEKVDYLDTWNDFYDQPTLFADDGLHLNAVGSARFGRLLSNGVCSFWQKNAQRSGATSTPT